GSVKVVIDLEKPIIPRSSGNKLIKLALRFLFFAGGGGRVRRDSWRKIAAARQARKGTTSSMRRKDERFIG
ncbi:hypothetical protein U1Q18_025791, partial [Sarracenia purpurea var. burkii]